MLLQFLVEGRRMDVAEFNRQIRSSWNLVSSRFEIGRSFIWNNTLPVSIEFRDVTLDEASTYSMIYRCGLRLSHHNFLLKDYSYFQFSREGSSSWRLAYFPNPWVAGVDTAARQLEKWESQEATGELSHEEVSMLMDEFEYYGSIPPVRFEYSANQYKEIAHPAAHFHIGRDGNNRWPVAVAIGPSLFTMLIAKLYYPKQWGLRSRYHDLRSVDDCVEALLIGTAETAAAVQDFSEAESRSLHFGRNMVATVRTAAKVARGDREPRRRRER
jgi:hypothetical protein